MSRAVFYIGPAGSGKTSGARTLNPESTFFVNTLGKDLPWRGSAKQYTKVKTEGQPPDTKWVSGNMIKTSHASVILKWLDFISTKMPHIKDVVIDDNTFVTSLELLRRSKETTWDKYNDIANNFIAISEKAKSLRDDLVIHILHHTQQEGDGILEEKTTRAMSYGKLIDEKLGSQEAQFTIVLKATKEKTDNGIEYFYYTKDANSTVKTPLDMFEDEKIPNDMQLVRNTIDCYYDEDCKEEKVVEVQQKVNNK